MSMPSKLGRYRVIREVGRGPLSATYLGCDDELGRKVAIKIPCGSAGSDETVRTSFVREATLALGLWHPSIVEVVELAEHEGVPFIAFEWLHGMWLRDAIRAGLRPQVGVSTMLQILDALGYLHEQGIIHCDIKPATVLLRGDGPAKIMDLTAARSKGGQVPGAVVGTADYMSPEHVNGDSLDERSDLFSVGCVLYQLIAGKPPFHEDNLMATFYRITHEEPDWRLIPPGPKWEPLRRVIMRALRKEPRDRYARAHAMSTDLSDALKNLGETESRRDKDRPLTCADCGQTFPANLGVDVFGRVLCERCAGNKPHPSIWVLTDLLRRFQKGVDELLSDEDHQTRYNLGIAYREIGLIDQAIAEFQLAAKDDSRLLECASMLGICFLEKGMPELAVEWFEKGLQAPGRSEEEYQGLRYDLASALEASGETNKAAEIYRELYEHEGESERPQVFRSAADGLSPTQGKWLALLNEWIGKIEKAYRVLDGTLAAWEGEEILRALERSKRALAEDRREEFRISVLRLQRAARILEQASRRF